LRQIAEKKARFQMIIARIALQEKVEVSDEERDKVIDDYAAEHKLTPEQIEILKKRESFRYRLLEEKTMSFLLEKAQVT
jgi:FKBP-type peptidyl-prolyl cis-trans isomerase (trigger factor)